MTKMELVLDGHPRTLSPAPVREGDQAWVPLASFVGLLSCVVKDVGEGRHTVCHEEDRELCVLLGDDETRLHEGVLFGRLGAFADALELWWSLDEDDILRVGRGVATTPLAIGDRPPEIRLPEMGSEVLVSSDDVLGKPAVFYMWASW